jgi:polar amino acid transport system substrate-binding protein
MHKVNWSLTLFIFLGGCAHMSTPTSTAAVTPELRREFAPSGTLVAATNYGNVVIAQKPAAGQDPQGVGPELARELAKRLGVPIKYVTYDVAGKVAEAASTGAWDVAFLAVDPERQKVIGFSAPYVNIEGTYLVRQDSALKRLEDFDRAGLKIAVGDKAAYDLFLTRHLKNATLVRYPTSQAAIDAYMAGQGDAVAGVREALVANAKKKSGYRVIEGAYMTIGQAVGVPKGRDNAQRYLHAFVEEMKSSGFVAKTLAATGQVDATVAPAAPRSN